MMATTEWLTNAIKAVELYIELSQTSITCANCKKPTYFPGYTLEQVRERFKDMYCGMCLKRMFEVK
jgi:Zn finger protein HypA/HybF involved in hydrogenase expression